MLKVTKMRLFKNMSKEKEMIDKELTLYKREKKLEIDQELANYRKNTYQEIHDLRVQCANDTKNLEHKYHSNQEELGVAIAKLEAKKESLEEINKAGKVNYEKMLDDKDKEIDRLNEIINKLIDKSGPEVLKTEIIK